MLPFTIMRSRNRMLDNYPTGLWAALSYRKLIDNYAGSCIRIRRSSDNTEQDIGFVGRLIDSAAITSFVGAGDGFVRTVYDQSGNGNHFIQTTSANQPRVALAGVLDGFIRFDASNDSLISANTSGGANTALTMFTGKSTLRTTTGTQMVIEHTADTNSNNGADWLGNSGSTAGAVARNASAQIVSITFATNNFDGTSGAVRFDTTEATTANKAKLYRSGALQTAGTGVTGVPTGAFANANYYIGGRGGASLFATLNMRDAVIYQGSAGLSDGEILAICGILGSQ